MIQPSTLWDALTGVVDPEVGLNVVDLGLIYDLQVSPHGHVAIAMTVTSPGCPMVDSLVFGIETVVLAVEGVTGVDVQVVHEPPWSPSMIRPEARRAAGIL